MTFSIEQLTTFVAVYETKSFSKAATQLGKHRTTTSQVISNLEDDLAIPLFERVGRSVEATNAGRMLYHYAKMVVQQATALNKVAMSLSAGMVEEINIAYSSFIPNNVLVAIRDRLSEQFPLLKVNYFIRSKPEIEAGLENGDFQFAFVNVDARRAMHSKDATFLRNLSFCVYASKYSELARTPRDLVLSKLKTTRQLVLKSMVDDEMAEKIIMSANYEVVDSLALMVKLIKEDIGWGVMPSITFHDNNIEGIIELEFDEFEDAFMVPVGFWCAFSENLTDIKQAIKDAVSVFLETAPRYKR